jgi:hypothetical protein
MAEIKTTCAICKKEFLLVGVSNEQPGEPTQGVKASCPYCRAENYVEGFPKYVHFIVKRV